MVKVGMLKGCEFHHIEVYFLAQNSVDPLIREGLVCWIKTSLGALKLNWIEKTCTCNAPFIQSPQKRSAAVHIVTNECVFSNFLKTGKVKVPPLRSIRRLFQATGPATEKPRPHIVTVLVDGMRRSPAAAERNWEWPAWEESGTQNSDRYAGAASWRHL